MVSDRPVTRFAPSPTGRMHAGNIYAYLTSWLIAKSSGGKIVLRIEDLDSARSRDLYADKIMTDLERLGLYWDIGPIFQHDRTDAYSSAFEKISESAHTYPCFCTRSQLLSFNDASAPHDTLKHIYSGKCRTLSREEADAATANAHSQGRNPSYRLEVDDYTISFNDCLQGIYSENLARDCGDFVLKRSDGGYAYQLAVVVDDAYSNVTAVIRGADLLSSTPQQIYLQRLLGLPEPSYYHIPVFTDDKERRLAKRNRDAAIDELISNLGSPAAVIGHIAYIGQIIDSDEIAMPEEILRSFDFDKMRERVGKRRYIKYR